MTFRVGSNGHLGPWAALLLLIAASVSAQGTANQQQQQQHYPLYTQQYPPQQYPPQQYPYRQQQYPPQQYSQAQHPQQQNQYPVQPYSDSNWKYQQHQRLPLEAPAAAAAPAPAPAPTPAAAPAPAATVDPWTAEVDRIISRGVLQLSLSLAAAVERDSDQSGLLGNVVLSPVNVAAALALVLAGSNGTTFQEIAKVLGIATNVDVLQNREQVHKEFGRFLSQLETQSTLVPPGKNASANQVVVANGLFVQKDFSIRPYFAQIAQSYRSEVIPVEFYRDPGNTKEKINSWFSERTRGRIKSVLAEAPPADTRLMIASALFFNGAWETPFPLEATMIRPFNAYNLNGTKELFAVRMMTNNLDLPYVADRALGCRMLELPYLGRDASMYLMLPDAQGLDKLRELESRLTPDIIEGLIAGMKEAPVIYSVPRMKLERSISLRTALETLGVRSMFDARLADLSHLADPVDPAPATTPSAPNTTSSQAAPAPAAASAAAPTTPSPTTIAPRTTPSTATPKSSSPSSAKRPGPSAGVGDSISNTIAPNAPLYFADRMTDVANPEKVNSSGPENSLFEHYMAPSTKLYADDVLHKVEVEVTETGTVASAATAITISRDGSNHVMRFNRPFVFFIRHNPTGLVLFYGSVVRPRAEWIVPGVDPHLLLPPSGAHRPPPHGRQAQAQQLPRRPTAAPQG